LADRTFNELGARGIGGDYSGGPSRNWSSCTRTASEDRELVGGISVSGPTRKSANVIVLLINDPTAVVQKPSLINVPLTTGVSDYAFETYLIDSARRAWTNCTRKRR
jgi:hypothetical protein